MITGDVLATLGVLILRRDPEGAFKVEGTTPLWYQRLVTEPVKQGDAVDVAGRFPFLETFLPTAENFWGAKDWGRIRSGYWVESYASGEELPLQASAAVVDGKHLLLVESVKNVYQQEKGLLQKARENMLAREQADSLKGTLHDALARARALLEAIPGTALRLGKDGRVREGSVDSEQLTPGMRREILACGERAMTTGLVQVFECEGRSGRVAPVSQDEFWIVFCENLPRSP